MNDRSSLVLITGGASGIGAASAEALAASGHAVALLDRDADALEQHADVLRGKGADVLTLHADLLDSSAVVGAITAAGEYGPLRGAVHAAGVFQVGTVAPMSMRRPGTNSSASSSRAPT